jgi:NADPH2:quinone reductase
MRAYFIESGPHATRLESREVPKPEATPGKVLVRVRAAGLNRGEFIAGHGIVKPGAPRPAGNEAAGEVVGSGARVMGRAAGAFAEYALMDAREAIAVPANLSFEEAAAIPLTIIVVHDILVEQGNHKPGEWLLVTGVSSGVGVAALQAAKAMGAKVIGTSGSASKLDLLKKHGLDVAIQTRKPDFAKTVLEKTDGKGANLVVNTVGGTVFAECLRAMAFQGRLAIVGYVDGSLSAEVDLDAVHAKRLHIFGVSNKLRYAEQRVATVQGFTANFLPFFAGGRIKPLIDRVFAFEDLGKAKSYMESDAHVGKIVLSGP